MGTGTLVLVPAWIAEDRPPSEVLSPAVLARVRGLRDFVVEDARSARRFLAACGHPGPMAQLSMQVLDEHTRPADVPSLLAPARAGRDLGLLSEAGAPAVADPGARLVACAHDEGVRVVPLVGPSSILLALMASGLEGQRFRFAGYLPATLADRVAAIRALESRSAANDETQVFIETPYRNDALLADVLKTCGAATRLCVAVDLTGEGEAVMTASIAHWRRQPKALGKRPAIFLLLAAKGAKPR